MNNPTSNNLPSFRFTNRTILRLNRNGMQHFHGGRYPEASKCFLSAIQTLKRACSLGGDPQDLSFNDDHCTLDFPRATRLGAVLQPMDFCEVCFSSRQLNLSSNPLRDIHSKYELVSFVLIYNLASSIHHYALVIDDQHQEQQQANSNKKKRSNINPTMSRDILENRALRLYQTVYDGVSMHKFTISSHGLDSKETHSRQVVLGQQLLLSTSHNMGLLLSTDDKQERKVWIDETVLNSNTATTNKIFRNNSRKSFPSSYRCFQVVFATLHRLRDYYGIQHSDFPSDFELQLVIDTALERLQLGQKRTDHSPLAFRGGTAPCA